MVYNVCIFSEYQIHHICPLSCGFILLGRISVNIRGIKLHTTFLLMQGI